MRPRTQDADEKKSKANDSTVVYFDCKNTEIAKNIFYIHKKIKNWSKQLSRWLYVLFCHMHICFWVLYGDGNLVPITQPPSVCSWREKDFQPEVDMQLN